MTSEPLRSNVRSPWPRIRWRIFAGIAAVGFTAYLERRSIAVASVQMMPELGLNKIALGYLFASFLITYTFLQYPGGLVAQRLGPKRTTFACLLLSSIGTAATAFAPSLSSGTVLLITLCLAQAVVGISQAPLIPSNSGLLHAWFPPRRWAAVNGLQVTGLMLGAAAAPPLIATLMVARGWRFALYAACVPGLIAAAIWWWYVRNAPREHVAVCAAELAEIEPEPRKSAPPAAARDEAWRVVRERNVLLLSLGYMLMSYVFYFFNQWSFLYLVDARHLTLLKGGSLASIPLFAGAVGATLGGVLCDAARSRVGVRWGFRLVPLVMLPLSAALLVVAARTSEPYGAVAALAGCFGCVEMTESAFWGATFWVTRERVSAGTGILNMGGNLGGILGTAIVARLAEAHDWLATLATGVCCALASAALWLLIDVERPHYISMRRRGNCTGDKESQSD